MRKKRMGYFRKSSASNQRLIELFERNQKKRYSMSPKDWDSRYLTRDLAQEERQARKEVLGMLRRGEVRTRDDFYRAGHFFHHGSNFRDYALGLVLFAASRHLGDLWGKNYYAVALDRFLVFVKQPQYFVTQFEKRKGTWILSPYRKGVSDRERKEYFVEPLEKTKKDVKKMNEEER